MALKAAGQSFQNIIVRQAGLTLLCLGKKTLLCISAGIGEDSIFEINFTYKSVTFASWMLSLTRLDTGRAPLQKKPSFN
jgi:hypothetical protein